MFHIVADADRVENVTVEVLSGNNSSDTGRIKVKWNSPTITNGPNIAYKIIYTQLKTDVSSSSTSLSFQ